MNLHPVRLWWLCCALAALSGCASMAATPKAAEPPSQSIIDRTHADLQAAAAMADQAHDVMAPVRAKCYRALDANLPAIPALPTGEVIGLATDFELKAQFVENAKTLSSTEIPMEVRLACAPVVARGNEILVSFGLRLVGAGILPR